MELLNFTLNETADTAKEMLKEDIVFLASNDVLYMNGEKHSYDGLGARSFVSDEGCVMVDAELFAKALNVEISLVGEAVKIGENSYSVTKRNGIVYIYAAKVAEDMGKYVYEDNRNFVLISNEIRDYVNSTDTNNNKENSDVIWRYLHFDRPSYDALYDALVKGENHKKHPRLFVKKDSIASLREKVEGDTYMQGIRSRLIEEADALMNEPPRDRIQYGIRLFGSCAMVKERLMVLATAYLLTDDKKYAYRAWAEIEHSLNWSDLNTRQHFLDSGEYGPGIAIAYDVFYDCFTDEQKAFVRKRIAELYFDECITVYHDGANYNGYNAVGYKNTNCNWGAVCGTSMLMCALTLMDEEAPESEFTAKCKYLAVNAMQTLEHIATVLTPEGKWDEGMGYWEYVLEHFGWTMTSLNNIFGTTFGFKEVPGMSELPKIGMYLQTLNSVFNFASTTYYAPRNFAPEVFVYATLYDDMGCAKAYDDFYKTLNLKYGYYRYMFFAPKYDDFKDAKANIAPDRYYKTSGMCSMRTGFDNPDGIYVGIVGGATERYNNCHFDKGSFVFEALGERWLIDMGRNGNDTHPYLRRTETHNTLTVNPTADYT